MRFPRQFAMLFLLFASFVLSLSAKDLPLQQDSIWGVAPQYAGADLNLYVISDGISEQKRIISTSKVASDGSFSFCFKLPQTQKCYVDFPAFIGCLFVEPGNSYQVDFPADKKISKLQKLNPYIKKQTVLLSLISPPKEDLNVRIEVFEDSLDASWNRLLFEGALTPIRIEAEMRGLEDQFSEFGPESPFFDDYRYYNYALMANLYEQSSPALAIDNFFINEPPAYNSPVYWESFDILFSDLPYFEGIAPLNQELYELVLLQQVKLKRLPLSQLDKLSLPRTKKIAHFLKASYSVATVGSLPVYNSFLDLEGNAVSLAEFTNNKTYLVFTSSALEAAQADISFAQALKKKKHMNYPNFLFIFVDESLEETRANFYDSPMRQFIYNWNNKQALLDAFDIKELPVYVLLDEEGRILKSPAQSPEREFATE